MPSVSARSPETETTLDRKLLLALAGMQLQNLPETRGDLLGVLQDFPGLYRLIRPSRTKITALATSPDGRLLASVDAAGVVRFERPEDLEPERSGGPARGRSVRAGGGLLPRRPEDRGRHGCRKPCQPGHRRRRLPSPEPHRIVAVDPRRGGPPQVHPPRVLPRQQPNRGGGGDGDAVVSGSGRPATPVGRRGKRRVVWERNYPLRPGQNEAQVEFTRAGMIVTSGQQGDTLLWHPRTGRVVRRFRFGGPFALSPDGHFAAVAQNSPNPADPAPRWRCSTSARARSRSLEALPARAWIVALGFTRDGKSVVGASFEGALRVWNVASGSIEQTFDGQPSGLNLAVAAGRECCRLRVSGWKRRGVGPDGIAPARAGRSGGDRRTWAAPTSRAWW